MEYLTKFRAFQLESEGSLFSYYKPDWYTLIEARVPNGGIGVLHHDLSLHGKTKVDTLHITSWDFDHCNPLDLNTILFSLTPRTIECPPYSPTTEDGRRCVAAVAQYRLAQPAAIIQPITADYIRTLPYAEPGGNRDVVFESQYNCDNKNDMSLLRLFRSEGFNVLSLGDCESELIASRLLASAHVRTAVDVLILPHHGADNGFTSGRLLDSIQPSLAICSSSYDNQYDHPRPSICQLLNTRNIPIMTTKRGDVIVFQTPGGKVRAVNFIRDNATTENNREFFSKRSIQPNRAA